MKGQKGEPGPQGPRGYPGANGLPVSKYFVLIGKLCCFNFFTNQSMFVMTCKKKVFFLKIIARKSENGCSEIRK